MALKLNAVCVFLVWTCLGVAYGLRGPWKKDTVSFVTTSPIRRHDTESIQPILQPGDVLDVCECENASLSSHGGLQCEREGWFIYSFEAVGRWVRIEQKGLL
jgi:hypothetical protein